MDAVGDMNGAAISVRTTSPWTVPRQGRSLHDICKGKPMKMPDARLAHADIVSGRETPPQTTPTPAGQESHELPSSEVGCPPVVASSDAVWDASRQTSRV
ncbi:hypothetical protein CGRA01v4_00723 [Colletotrichum graminicola]|nr:hypothetical protein CGRA01v4_00723 [Colletotrichum graminicola]